TDAPSSHPRWPACTRPRILAPAETGTHPPTRRYNHAENAETPRPGPLTTGSPPCRGPGDRLRRPPDVAPDRPGCAAAPPRGEAPARPGRPIHAGRDRDHPAHR